jgi:aminoglycoside 6'-N-acetyltransferase I
MNSPALLTSTDPGWLRLRIELWPDTSPSEHLDQMASFLAQPERYVQFLSRNEEREAVGFVEASLRSDYVNGTESSPVAFLEGLYVVPKARGAGVARSLVAAVAEWARSKGCSELASDTPLENTLSQAVHARLGFMETERVVYFSMRLKPHAT